MMISFFKQVLDENRNIFWLAQWFCQIDLIQNVSWLLDLENNVSNAKVHSFLKQYFAQSSFDTICWYVVPSADFQANLSWLCQLKIMQNTVLKTIALYTSRSNV